MRKRILAFLVAITMLFAASSPALAVAENLDEELARVTNTVKVTLGIDNSFPKFSSSVSDSKTYRNWYLTWSGDEIYINVTADSSGKILNYYRYKTEYPKETTGYAPAFPKTSRDDALPAATTFINKVLKDGETANFNEGIKEVYPVYKVGAYNFSGSIMLNGIKSPISFYISVSSGDMSVSNFSRSDSYGRTSGPVPSATPSVSPESALKLLASKVKLKLQYVLAEDGKTAVLRFLPVYSGNYIVKADTGELLNIDPPVSVYPTAAVNGMGDKAKSSYPSGLSQVELSAVSELEGVMPKDKLDAVLRSTSGLGLDESFTLESSSYSKDGESGKIYCSLSYVKKISDLAAIKERFPDFYSSAAKSPEVRPVYIHKYVVLDAKTAELKYISGGKSVSGNEKKVLNADALSAKASQFLQNNLGLIFAKTTLNTESSNPENGLFVYSETVNKVQFPQNSISISLDTYDGTVSNLYYSWKDGYAFDTSEGLVSPDSAMESYLACFKPILQYVYATQKEAPDSRSLMLVYKLEASAPVSGIDAKTGKAIIMPTETGAPKKAYDDIEGCYGKTQIEALAKYGIGFSGKSFLPENQITQKDALTLLLSAVGYSSEEKDDYLYEAAYRYGFINRGEKKPDKLLNRAEYIKMLIAATEYGAAAKLNGIYICGFTDDSEISSDYYGFVAIAKALGIVKGDTENNFSPLSLATRQDAAIMLYNFMSRN